MRESDPDSENSDSVYRTREGTDDSYLAPDPKLKPGDKQPRPENLGNCRIIPVGQYEGIIAFDMVGEGDSSRSVTIRLTPAGEQADNERNRIEITEAEILSAENQEVLVESGMMSLSSNIEGRVTIRVTTKDRIDNLAFRIG